MVDLNKILIGSITALCTVACTSKSKTAYSVTDTEEAPAMEEYIPEEEETSAESFSNIKEVNCIPDCPQNQEINTDNLEYYEGRMGYDEIKCLDHNVSKKDRYVLYSHRVESTNPAFDPFCDGNKFKAERIVNIVAPIEIKAQHPGAYHLTSNLTYELISQAFPEEYRVSREDGTGLYSFQKTIDAWLHETLTATETDYQSQGIAIFPISSNDQYVQYCILTHSAEGGNSDMPEIKFVFAGRKMYITAPHLAIRIANIVELSRTTELERLAQKYLSRTLKEKFDTEFDGQLDFGYSWETPYITYEEEGICAWFPKGTTFMGAGIIPVRIPLSELRPYLKEGMIRMWGSDVKNWRTYPMLSSYGKFE